MSKKQILIIIGLVVLLIAIPLTLYLARKQQTVKSKASFSTQVEFLDENGNIITQTNKTRVKLRIKKDVTPSEQPSASPSPSTQGGQSI